MTFARWPHVLACRLAAPQDSRTINSSGITRRRIPTRLPSSKLIAARAACSPNSLGCERIVVSAGLVKAANGKSSNPTTAISAGTERPAALIAAIAPTAMVSLLANKAVGITRCRKISFIASNPLSLVNWPIAKSFLLKAIPASFKACWYPRNLASAAK